MQNQPPNRTQHIQLVTRAELADFLRIPPSQIDRMVSERRLPGVYRIGHRTLRFDLQRIIEWLASTEVGVISVNTPIDD